jgi:hypothetical protein
MKLINPTGDVRITFAKSADMLVDEFIIVLRRIVSLDAESYEFAALTDDNGFLDCNRFVAFVIDPSTESVEEGEYMCELYCDYDTPYLVASMLVRVKEDLPDSNEDDPLDSTYDNVILL